MKRDRRLPAQEALLAVCLLALSEQGLLAGQSTINWVGGVGNSLSQPASFYGSEEALRIAETVLLYQRDKGGWPKNYDRARRLSEADRKKLLSQKKQNGTTFDNGATHSEVRYLAKVYGATVAGVGVAYPLERMPIVRALAGEVSTVDHRNRGELTF